MYGSRGVLRRTDLNLKRDEFDAWCREVRKTDPRGRAELETLFSEFCEDFNTCTLPSEKYYNLAAWERAQAAAAAAGPTAARSNFSMLDDAEAHRRESEAARRAKAEEQMRLLRQAAIAPGRLAEVRVREDLLARQKYAFDRGDVHETARIAGKLKDLDKHAAEAKFK